MHCLTPGFPYTQEDKEEKEASSPTRTLIQMMEPVRYPTGLEGAATGGAPGKLMALLLPQ